MGASPRRLSDPEAPGGSSLCTVVGTQVSHYRIINRIGEGGMGTVYLAEDTTLKRQVALKFLSPDRLGSRDAAARLLREARAASCGEHSRERAAVDAHAADYSESAVTASWRRSALLRRGPCATPLRCDADRTLACRAESAIPLSKARHPPYRTRTDPAGV
jgi:hypothetical protein